MKRIIIAIALIIAGCSEQPEVIPYEYTKIFTGETQKAWTIRSLTYTEEGHASISSPLEDCESDDLYIFYANPERKMEVLDGGVKCETDDPDVMATGSWSYSTANATLTLPFPLIADIALPFVVREALEDRMTIEIFFADGKSSYRFNFRAADAE